MIQIQCLNVHLRFVGNLSSWPINNMDYGVSMNGIKLKLSKYTYLIQFLVLPENTNWGNTTFLLLI